MGTHWPVPVSHQNDSLRLGDKLQIGYISQPLVKHQASNEASIVMGDFHSKWKLEASHRGDKAFNSLAESARLSNGPSEVPKPCS